MRLELVKTSNILNFPVYLLDFVKKREVGLGRMADATAIKDIKLDHGENFGEETAALYIPKKKWLAAIIVFMSAYAAGTLARIAEVLMNLFERSSEPEDKDG